jgi:isopenicillin N synthase-like dioxygenase
VDHDGLARLDAGLLSGGPTGKERFAQALAAAAAEHGAFYLVDAPIPAALRAAVLDAARAFFDLPAAEKAAVSIRRSPCFRGYSAMQGGRDFREQLHLGPEAPLPPAKRTASDGLSGPNLWPASLGARFRDAMEALLLAGGALGRRLLEALALALGVPDDAFADADGEAPYLLLKLIAYHPQTPGLPPRDGVAAHCDFSWLTLLLQDEADGLQTQAASGTWLDAPPLPDALFVNLGELAEVASGGRFRAAPHRVRNPSPLRRRISVPLFVNPALSTRVAPLVPAAPAPRPDGPHVHRVLAPGAPAGAFTFGDLEWHRKGLGHWCHDACCLRES